MKILLLTQLYAPVIGGEERHVQNLAQQLARRGHDVHVGTQALDGNPSVGIDEVGVHIHRMASVSAKVPSFHTNPRRPHALPVPDPLLASGLHKLVKEINPDVVHAHNWIINSFLPIQRRSPRPLLMSLHGYEHRCGTTRFMNNGAICDGPSLVKCFSCTGDGYGYEKGTAMLAATWFMKPFKERIVDRFLPVSQSVADKTGLDRRRLPYEIVPNFIPDSLLQGGGNELPRPDEIPEGDYLLFVGDLTADKGIATVLKAYGMLPAPKPQMVVVGRRTPSMPTELPEGAVVGTDWRHDKVIAAFQHALSAVLPSEWPDPCPTTVLEAMAIGAPLITTPVGGIVDMVDSESALMVPPADVDELHIAMACVIEDEVLRARLASGAAERVQRFAMSRAVSRIEQIYSEVVVGPQLAMQGAV
jgi:glycosyltransferase involved in cell wall biosynthesis